MPNRRELVNMIMPGGWISEYRRVGTANLSNASAVSLMKDLLVLGWFIPRIISGVPSPLGKDYPEVMKFFPDLKNLRVYHEGVISSMEEELNHNIAVEAAVSTLEPYIANPSLTQIIFEGFVNSAGAAYSERWKDTDYDNYVLNLINKWSLYFRLADGSQRQLPIVLLPREDYNRLPRVKFISLSRE